MVEEYVPFEEQLYKLESHIDRLWWFAQFEKAVEEYAEQEPIVGSETVLNVIIEETEPNRVDMFDIEWTAANLQLYDERR